MSGTRPAEILRQLEQIGLGSADPETDRDLLDRFTRSRDQAAFAALVQRHGPMVLAVCRRVIAHPQDAEDAFQAVFLVLARKAGAIRSPGLLGNWLYGVAVRVARRARRSAARRRGREVQVVDMPDPLASAPELAMDLGPVLHEELAALPACYRDAIVLCDLRGASRADAAKALGIPEGTLSSRLAGGRKRLAGRLARRGVTLSAAAVPAALADGWAWSAVPERLLSKTCGLVANWAAGGAVPGSILRLAQGRFSVKTLLLCSTMAAALAMGGAVLASRTGNPPEEAPPPKPTGPIAVRLESPAPPDPKPDGKTIGLASTPRMRNAIDLPINQVESEQVFWSPNGKGMAFRTSGNFLRNGQWHQGGNHVLFVPDVFTPVPTVAMLDVPKSGTLVGFSPDGNAIVTAQREYSLVSGFHRLQFWAFGAGGQGVAGAPPPMDSGFVLTRTVNLDSDHTYGYAFARDGKTFRTVAAESHLTKGLQVSSKLAIQEIDATTGETLRTLLHIDGEFRAFALSANGGRFAAIDAVTERLTVWDVTRAAKLSSFDLPPMEEAARASFSKTNPSVVISPDGRRIACYRANGRTVVIDSDKAELLPTPVGGEYWHQVGECSQFSEDGRLLAASGSYRVETGRQSSSRLRPAPNPGGKGDDRGAGPKNDPPAGRPTEQIIYTFVPALSVWDSMTGKQLRGWDRKSSDSLQVAVHPTRPLVAILEPNKEGSMRLGLWDFEADTARKK